MTKLSDTQLVILGAAAQRADLSVLPLPDSLKLKGGALAKVMDSLRNRGLIRVLGGDGGPERVVITSEGMAAIGVEPDGDGAPAGADTAPTSAAADSAAEAPAPASEADGAEKRAKTMPAKGNKARTTARASSGPEAAAGAEPTGKPTPRTGTKQAQMIEMLKRPEGATVEQIAEATGWQDHTIRGAISGALKKKLGLTGRGHPHARGRPQQDRLQGQQHRLPDHWFRSGGQLKAERQNAALAQATGLSALRGGQSRGQGPARRAGHRPSRSRPRAHRAGAERGHHGPHRRRVQRGRGVRG